MSRTIKTYDDLCEERERMKSLLIVQKQRIKDDWQDIKNEFTPVKKAFSTVGKFVSGDRSNPLVNASLKVASDLFLTNFVLAKAGWLTKLTIPFVVRNYSSHMLADKGRTLLSKLGNLFKGKTKTIGRPGSNGATDPLYDKTTDPLYE